MAKEFEIKFTQIDKDSMRKKLAEAGLVCVSEEFAMKRRTFHPLTTTKNEWFRIRKEHDKTTMTYKCIHSPEIDGIEEYEVVINDFESATEILLRAGLKSTSTQENLREIWINDEIEVCIDTWPGLSPYIEIEGSDAEIVKFYTSKLGYDWDLGIFGGSEAVYERELGIPTEVLVKLSEISFAHPPKAMNS